MKRLAGWILLCGAVGYAQVPSKTILCDESHGCTHQYVNGELFKTIGTPDGTIVTAGMVESTNGKYLRLNVSVFNGTATTFDVLPEDFQLEIDGGRRPKTLYPIPPEQIAKTAERGAWWANYINRVGAALSHNTSTTNTSSSSSSSGTINAQSSDGTYSTGTYSGVSNGSSTSTTTTPDYEARAIAEQRVKERNAKVAAANTQMMQTALKDNTLAPGQAIGGYVYFTCGWRPELHPQIVIGGTVYEFAF